jgi:hypothetical protein
VNRTQQQRETEVYEREDGKMLEFAEDAKNLKKRGGREQ